MTIPQRRLSGRAQIAALLTPPALLVLVVIGWLTLRPAPEVTGLADLTPWWCISCGDAGSADLFQNVLLFLPLGLAWRRAGATFLPALLAALALTVTIEATQALTLPGRDAALGDLLANSLGGGLGWALWPTLTRAMRPDTRLADQLAGAAMAAFTLQSLLAAWLLVPDLRRPGPWQVTATPPRFSDGKSASSELLDLRLDNAAAAAAVPGRRGPVEARLRMIWRDGAGEDRLSLARLERNERDILIGFGIADGTLGAGVRQSATWARFRGPQVALPLPQLADGDTLTAILRQGGGTLSLDLAGSGGGNVAAQVPLGTAQGWLLINPFSQRVLLPDTWLQWTIAWLAGWGLLLGWGAGASGRPLVWGTLAVVVAGAIAAAGESRWSSADLLALATGWLVAAALSRSRRAVAGAGATPIPHRGRSAASAASP
ncbi:MAG: VanZ family protein [Gemmatimonadales bacterium]|nr:VanZ family protein [Gemmatimonadales bacterium]